MVTGTKTAVPVCCFERVHAFKRHCQVCQVSGSHDVTIVLNSVGKGFGWGKLRDRIAR